MKRLLTLVLTLTMVLGNVPTFAGTADMSPWAADGVSKAIKEGYVPKHLQERYQEDITREEFAELLVHAIFENAVQSDASHSEKDHVYYKYGSITPDNFLKQVKTDVEFTDTDNKSVKIANMLGIVNGIGNGKFDPKGKITREQAMVMFVNYGKMSLTTSFEKLDEDMSDVTEISPWALNYVKSAYGAGLVSGTKQATYTEPVFSDFDGSMATPGHANKDGMISPKGNITIEQSILIVSRAMEKMPYRSIRLRGFFLVIIDTFNNGLEIEGDTVKIPVTGLDYDGCSAKEQLREKNGSGKWSPLIDLKSSELYAMLSTPGIAYKTIDGEDELKAVEIGSFCHNIGPIHTDFNLTDNDYILVSEYKASRGFLVNGKLLKDGEFAPVEMTINY